MVHNTNCFAYVVTAYTDNLLFGYYKGGTTFPETTSSIWYAKFVSTSKAAEKMKQLVEKEMPFTNIGKQITWKIQKVTMNAPVDVE